MIRIVSDSSALYSKKDGQAKGVTIAPLIVTINGKTYREYEDINTEEFINIINEGHIPVSSQPAIGEVLNIYDENIEDEIINISMADGLSGTYNSACVAKDMATNPDRIEVINSETLCGPQNYLVDLAVELVKLGKTKNEIVSEKQESAIAIFIDQFKDLLVIILIVAGIISAISGEFESTLVILIVISLNAALGTFQTVKAQKSIDCLKKLSIPKVKVIRDGKVQIINSNELVVGDIVNIEAGDIIAGDGRLKEAVNLQVNESALTGESNSVEKQLLPIEKKCTIGDMNNMSFQAV